MECDMRAQDDKTTRRHSVVRRAALRYAAITREPKGDIHGFKQPRSSATIGRDLRLWRQLFDAQHLSFESHENTREQDDSRTG
jgi:hypothetical protein